MGAHGTSRGLSAGGLGPLRSPGRAGGSGATPSSPASLASPRQLPNESRSVMSDIRDAEEGAGGRCWEQIFPVRFCWLKPEGFVQGKHPDSAPPAVSQRAPGVVWQETRGVGRGGDAGPLHGSALLSARRWQLGTRGLGQSGRNPLDGPPGPPHCPRASVLFKTQPDEGKWFRNCLPCLASPPRWAREQGEVAFSGARGAPRLQPRCSCAIIPAAGRPPQLPSAGSWKGTLLEMGQAEGAALPGHSGPRDHHRQTCCVQAFFRAVW